MEKRQQRGLFTVPGLLLALKLSLMVVIYLPGQHGLQRGHPDAAGSEKNHNGEGHPASRRERQQDVAQRVGPEMRRVRLLEMADAMDMFCQGLVCAFTVLRKN